jgi:hypothetical protein
MVTCTRAKKEHIQNGYQRARAIGSALEAGIASSDVQGASLAQTRAAISTWLRFEALMKTGLSKQVCGRRKQQRASDSAGPKNDGVRFYNRREL